MINRIRDVELPGDGRRSALRERVEAGRAGATPDLSEFGRRLETFIGDHPVMSLAMGLTIGIMIGCLIKRR